MRGGSEAVRETLERSEVVREIGEGREGFVSVCTGREGGAELALVGDEGVHRLATGA